MNIFAMFRFFEYLHSDFLSFLLNATKDPECNKSVERSGVNSETLWGSNISHLRFFPFMPTPFNSSFVQCVPVFMHENDLMFLVVVSTKC